MRFPLSLTTSLTGYLIKQKISGRKRFPLVLMLEPLHACNLTCTGCGRIREYIATIRERMSVEECLASADECGARWSAFAVASRWSTRESKSWLPS